MTTREYVAFIDSLLPRSWLVIFNHHPPSIVLWCNVATSAPASQKIAGVWLKNWVPDCLARHGADTADSQPSSSSFFRLVRIRRGRCALLASRYTVRVSEVISLMDRSPGRQTGGTRYSRYAKLLRSRARESRLDNSSFASGHTLNAI